MTSFLDSAEAEVLLLALVLVVAAAARCQDWAAQVLEAVWAPTWMVKGHAEDSKLMTGLIGAVAAAVMVEDVVVERQVDTRVADVLREGLGVVDVVRGGVVRVQHVEEADVTNFTHYHLQISISRTRES